jgi:hypothetical protein
VCREESGSFLKKRTKKLLLILPGSRFTPVAQINKRLFGSFSAEKELLAFSSG